MTKKFTINTIHNCYPNCFLVGFSEGCPTLPDSVFVVAEDGRVVTFFDATEEYIGEEVRVVYSDDSSYDAVYDYYHYHNRDIHDVMDEISDAGMHWNLVAKPF